MRRRPEARLERDILLELGKDPTVALYRNEVGQGYYGCVLPQIRKLLEGSPHRDAVLGILHRNRVTYGLGVGSPDLAAIGRGGRFTGLELKAGSSPSRDQLRWHEAARRRGAVIEVVRTVEEAREALTREPPP